MLKLEKEKDLVCVMKEYRDEGTITNYNQIDVKKPH